MPSFPRQAAVLAAVFGLSAGPALASPAMPSSGAVTAHTPLTAKIAYETPLTELKYRLGDGVDGSFGVNARASDHAAYAVEHAPADSAQLPAKLEWLLGADLQRHADNIISYGQHELVYHHPTTGSRVVSEGLTDLRLSNYFFADAASALGVRHPKYMAAPYQPVTGKPVKSKTPLIAKAPKPTLAATIAMGTPLLEQAIPSHILGTYVGLNEAAVNYYSALIGRMHVDGAQRSAQRNWVEGVRTLGRGDAQLDRGIIGVRYGSSHESAAGKREIRLALATFRRANGQIGHADALLGVHQSGTTVGLPTKVLYLF